MPRSERRVRWHVELVDVVHAPIRPSSRAATDDQFHAARRRYAVQMGVDPELVELADKTPHVNLRILTRDEIVRFQIETQRR